MEAAEETKTGGVADLDGQQLREGCFTPIKMDSVDTVTDYV